VASSRALFNPPTNRLILLQFLAGTVVAVTGASRGLGAALARTFAHAGARLSLCARDGGALREVRDSVEAIGAECVARAADVTIASDVDEWITMTEEILGAPEVLINNASILGPRLPLAQYPLEEWRAVLEVNLTGTLIATQRVLPAMLQRGEGAIVNVSSGAAIPPRTRWGAYAVSKTALEGLSLNLARELEGSGVRVNVVDPGSMRTRMRAEAYPEEDPSGLKEAARVSPLILWLAGRAAADVTGRRFQADEWIAGRDAGDPRPSGIDTIARRFELP